MVTSLPRRKRKVNHVFGHSPTWLLPAEEQFEQEMDLLRAVWLELAHTLRTAAAFYRGRIRGTTVQLPDHRGFIRHIIRLRQRLRPSLSRRRPVFDLLRCSQTPQPGITHTSSCHMASPIFVSSTSSRGRSYYREIRHSRRAPVPSRQPPPPHNSMTSSVSVQQVCVHHSLLLNLLKFPNLDHLNIYENNSHLNRPKWFIIYKIIRYESLLQLSINGNT